VGSVDEAVSALQRIPEIDRRACRRRVEQRFSIEAMVDGYEKVYARMLCGSGCQA
jgi:glycosyltransferase involved in cell wall biosynthesis